MFFTSCTTDIRQSIQPTRFRCSVNPLCVAVAYDTSPSQRYKCYEIHETSADRQIFTSRDNFILYLKGIVKLGKIVNLLIELMFRMIETLTLSRYLTYCTSKWIFTFRTRHNSNGLFILEINAVGGLPFTIYFSFENAINITMHGGSELTTGKVVNKWFLWQTFKHSKTKKNECRSMSELLPQISWLESII